MVIIRGVEVMEHGCGLMLRTATPCSQHTWSPALITKPVLAATTAKGVGSIHRPGLVAKGLQISCQMTCHHGGCLVAVVIESRTNKHVQEELIINDEDILWLFQLPLHTCSSARTGVLSWDSLCYRF